MIDIIVPFQTMSNYMTYLANDLPYLLSKYIDYDKYSFGNFQLSVVSENESFTFIYELIRRDDLDYRIMGDYTGIGEIIKYTDTSFLLDDDGNHSEMSIYIHPQICFKHGRAMGDLYVEPCIGYEDIFKEMASNDGRPMTYMIAMQALGRLDFVETRLKTDIKRIKRLRPNPEQIAQLDKTGAEYRSQPIKIKDVAVQYIYVPHETRKYKRHCEAWGVRGHFRHYKSGKVIYIHPHTKGKGKLKTTQYIIGG